MKVDIYFNLHKKCLSIRHKGKVIAHAAGAHLECVQFKVSEAGRQRVLREKRKNVHAVVRGLLVSHWQGSGPSIGMVPSPDSLQAVTYNPYKWGSFVLRKDEEPIHRAAEVLIEGRSIMARV
jgi:hypothetical protein